MQSLTVAGGAVSNPQNACDAVPVALTISARLAWGAVAVTAFHLAYELCPPLILLFLVGVYQLSRAARREQAMYSGWLIGLAIYGPQLFFFWSIFGFASIALWLVLATWLAIYLVLQRFALLKLGPALGALAAPFLWTGLEYFRSELYYLRFSWLNIGYAFAPLPRGVLLPFLGTYGVGFLLMLFASHFPFLRGVGWRQRSLWSGALLLLALAGPGLTTVKARSASPLNHLKVAGVQLEFPDEQTVLSQLEKLRAACSDTPLYVLGEYTFSGSVPAAVKNWCARNKKYLVAGGKDYLDASQKVYRNTAFVIGPDGSEIFSQAKKMPIQFFDDGKPASAQKLWDSPWGRLGLCVCYDLSYTRVTDELIRQGAQAIIVPTMDVEQWGERQHRLHARIAPIRAAEYGIPIFRLCSSGISQAVNAQGAVLATAPFPGQQQILEATLELSPDRASLPLDRVLVWPCLAVCVVILIWHLHFSFRRKAARNTL